VSANALEACTGAAATELAHQPRDPLGRYLASLSGPAGLRPEFDSLPEILRVLDLPGDTTPPVPAHSLGSHHGGVYGAQQLAQQIVLSERLAAGKATHTVHTVFPNPSRWDAPLDVDVEWLQSGQTFANLTLTFRQGGRAVSRADVLLGAEAPDFVRHEAPVPAGWRGPDGASPVRHPMFPWETRTAPGPWAFGLDLWQRIPDAPADPTMWRALAAFTTEPLAVHLAALAHEEHGTAPLAPGETAASAVLAETVTFVEEIDVRAWHLVRVSAEHAGHGRVLGRGEVRRADGRLSAVFECVGMLRALPATPGRQAGDG
jgi:acyl-CoA thioesterase-2